MHLFFKKTPVIGDLLKNAFLFYLLSHNRPIAELLNPNKKDLTELYANSFAGMSDDSVSLEALEQTRAYLVTAMNQALISEDKSFLMSFKQGTLCGICLV